jgi:hypothetical protein
MGNSSQRRTEHRGKPIFLRSGGKTKYETGVDRKRAMSLHVVRMQCSISDVAARLRFECCLSDRIDQARVTLIFIMSLLPV